MRSFFFAARVDDVPSYAHRIVEAMGSDFEGSLVMAAISEALLNAIIYGALRIPTAQGERDPVAIYEAIRAAEREAAVRAGIHVTVRDAPDEPGDKLVSIQDHGPGFDWRSGLLRLADADASPDEISLYAQSGRGLGIVLAGARAVRWNQTGNEITLQFRSSKAKPPTHPAQAPIRLSEELGRGNVQQNDGAELAPPAPPDSKTARPPAAEGSRQDTRILVVDDIETNRRVLAKMLEWEGYEVRLAGEGASAIAQVEEWGPQIVIMDVNMPRMTGVEALEIMRDRGLLRGTAVMLLTAARVGEDERCRAIEAGAFDVLEKPISRRELIARVTHRLGEQRRARALDERSVALEGELRRAADVMTAMMPPSRTALASATIDTLVLPCAAIGGDIVDFVRITEHRWAAFLLDVAGHGIVAALTASASRAVLRGQLAAGSSLEAAVRSLNVSLGADFDRTAQHAAVAAVLVDEDSGTVEVLNAGCPPVVVWDTAGKTAFVNSCAPPAGLLEAPEYRTVSCQLDATRGLVIASDGLVEGVASPADTVRALYIVAGTADPLSLPGLPREEIQDSLLRLGSDRDDASVVWIRFRQRNEAEPSAKTENDR